MAAFTCCVGRHTSAPQFLRPCTGIACNCSLTVPDACRWRVTSVKVPAGKRYCSLTSWSCGCVFAPCVAGDLSYSSNCGMFQSHSLSTCCSPLCAIAITFPRSPKRVACFPQAWVYVEDRVRHGVQGCCLPGCRDQICSAACASKNLLTEAGRVSTAFYSFLECSSAALSRVQIAFPQTAGAPRWRTGVSSPCIISGPCISRCCKPLIGIASQTCFTPCSLNRQFSKFTHPHSHYL